MSHASEPRTVAGLEIHYGWSQALSFVRAHYVPDGAPIRMHGARPIGDGPCHFPGMVDEAGHLAAGQLHHCSQCERWLTGECLDCDGRGVARAVVPETVCKPCKGTGRHP